MNTAKKGLGVLLVGGKLTDRLVTDFGSNREFLKSYCNCLSPEPDQRFAPPMNPHLILAKCSPNLVHSCNN